MESHRMVVNVEGQRGKDKANSVPTYKKNIKTSCLLLLGWVTCSLLHQYNSNTVHTSHSHSNTSDDKNNSFEGGRKMLNLLN